jgi:hypothetical protein
MLDRELLRHISDESDVLCDVLVGILQDLQGNRISLTNEDAIDERRRRFAPEAGRPPSVPDTTVSAHDFAVLGRQAATETTLSMRGDSCCGSVNRSTSKSSPALPRNRAMTARFSSRQIAGYLAKYVTKSAADFGIGVRRFSPGAIDQLDAVAPAGHIVLCWVMLAGSG